VKCPVCDVALLISSREGIEIDHCPQCRGVWLDRGELDKIIERAAPAVVGDRGARSPEWETPRREPERREPDRRHDDDWGDRRPRKKRRGSFLEDLFDFD
jgi:Zn-finger nucleic acid-binding protein